MLALTTMACLTEASFAHAAEAWQDEWQVAPGFSVTTDTKGYSFPTAIAFVPDPGPGPKDPLYFVTEIRGTLKVVTNDRSIHTFAEDIVRSKPLEEFPSLVAETGMAGLYLDAAHGYVYVSFAYRDKGNVLRNNLVRFESTPEVFSLEPTAKLAFTEIFADQPSDQSHQIGSMLVHEGYLYVSVGDARQTHLVRNVNSTLGKILRMTLDGKPVPDNPFYIDDDIKKPANFVWAYGLRNPFGLTIAEGGLFTVENGPGVDRFTRIHRGGDYLYDGSDWSMGLRAKAVFAPAVAPVHVTYLAPGSGIFPASFESRFFTTFGGFLGAPPGPGQHGERSVVSIEYDMDLDDVTSPPQPFLQYRGTGLQLPAGIAFGPDALYVAPLLPDGTGESRIIRVAFDPANEHSLLIGRDDDPMSLIATRGCLGCHSFHPEQPMLGPTLSRQHLSVRLGQRLDSSEYLESLDALDALDDDYYRSTRPARDAVRQAQGAAKIQVYAKNKILSPRFDNPVAQMALLGLSEDEATTISVFLASAHEETGLLNWPKKQLMRMIPRLRLRHVIFGFAAGVGTALLGCGLMILIVRGVRGTESGPS